MSAVIGKTYDDLSPEEKEDYDQRNSAEALSNKLAEGVRRHRNFLLQETDYTQVQDNPLDSSKRQEWLEYRKALRDIPSQEGFPHEVEWPVKPQ